jgi:hypothetical protein
VGIDEGCPDIHRALYVPDSRMNYSMYKAVYDNNELSNDSCNDASEPTTALAVWFTCFGLQVRVFEQVNGGDWRECANIIIIIR